MLYILSILDRNTLCYSTEQDVIKHIIKCSTVNIVPVRKVMSAADGRAQEQW